MMNFQTLKIRTQSPVYFIQIHRPEANNAINGELIFEMHKALDEAAETGHTIVVLEGLPETFCFGADFAAIAQGGIDPANHDPGPLYDLWHKLATGPYMSIAHVRGKANAGGIGFVAACDMVIADASARFSLSELLFGLIPACVMPFLIRKTGFQKAHYLTAMTQPITPAQALEYGLVDAWEEQSTALLRKHLLPLRRLSRKSIVRYKAFMNRLSPLSEQTRSLSLETNKEVFGDPQNIAAIERYVTSGAFPWETDDAHA